MRQFGDTKTGKKIDEAIGKPDHQSKESGPEIRKRNQRKVFLTQNEYK
jgi:hypothetical protein